MIPAYICIYIYTIYIHIIIHIYINKFIYIHIYIDISIIIIGKLMINHWISLKVKDQLDGDFLGKSFNRVNRDQV